MNWFFPREQPSHIPPSIPPQRLRIEGSAPAATRFSIERLATLIETSGFSCQIEDVGTGIDALWNNLPFRFCLSESDRWLGISTVWEAPSFLSQQTNARVRNVLQVAANEWNRHYLQPTAYPAQSGGKWTIVFHLSIFVGAGVSDAQMKTSLYRALDVNFQARETIVTLLPPAYQ